MCQWQSVGSTALCWKRCLYDLCGIHRAQLRKRPVSDVAKGRNRSLGSVQKLAALTEHKKLYLGQKPEQSVPTQHACGNSFVWQKGIIPCLSLASNKCLNPAEFQLDKCSRMVYTSLRFQTNFQLDIFIHA